VKKLRGGKSVVPSECNGVSRASTHQTKKKEKNLQREAILQERERKKRGEHCSIFHCCYVNIFTCKIYKPLSQVDNNFMRCDLFGKGICFVTQVHLFNRYVASFLCSVFHSYSVNYAADEMSIETLSFYTKFKVC
jgi:hypothetical protein